MERKKENKGQSQIHILTPCEKPQAETRVWNGSNLKLSILYVNVISIEPQEAVVYIRLG